MPPPRPTIDVIQVAHAHARFGSREAYTGPAMPELPAFRRMCLNQLGPGFSLEVLERSQQEINEVIRILQA